MLATVSSCARRVLASGVVRRFFADAAGAVRNLWRAEAWTRRVLVAFWIWQLIAVFWDLPTFYGWENDGAVPRDFLGGIADNLTPGETHRYPLLHYAFLGLVSAPVLIADLVGALVTGSPIYDVVVDVPSMTAITLLGKLLHLAMISVALLVLGRVSRTLFGTWAARWALLFAVTNLSIAYYGRAANVDAAYLMWVVLAIDRILILRVEPSTRHYRLFAFFAAASLASKDQAYAAYVLVVPLYLLVLPLFRRQLFGGWRSHLRQASSAGAWGAGFYAVLSGALFNPTGFLTRFAVLAGPNTEDYRYYEHSFRGVLANASDLWRLQNDFWWPFPVAVVAWLGVVLAFTRWGAGPETSSSPVGRELPWRLLPLVAGLGSTVAFALVVGRAEHRFVLPLGFWLAAYGGLFVATLQARLGVPRLTLARRAGAVALLAPALWLQVQLLVTQYCDPRRDVEAFLASQPPGTLVETYGLGVYLPRFDFSDEAPYRVTRVSALGARRPPYVRGMREIRDDFRHVAHRGPAILVLPDAYGKRFRDHPTTGQVQPPKSERACKEVGARDFFRALMNNRLPGYRLAQVGQIHLPDWYVALGGRALRVHDSTGEPVWVAVRAD